MVIIKCNSCGARKPVSAIEIIEGIKCPQCQAALRLDDGSASRVEDEGSGVAVEKCPHCQGEVSCRISSPMPLVWCPSCDIPFIRLSLPEFSTRRSNWDSERLFRLIEQNRHQKTGWITVDRQEARQVGVLKGLGIWNSEVAPEIAEALVQGIFHRAEQELARNYRQFDKLPEELRLKLCLRLACSPLLHPFYVENRNLNERQLEPLVKAELKDDFFYPLLNQDIDARSRALVGAYICEFGRSVYHQELAPAMLDYLVMKTFALGIGGEIRDSEYFLYYPETGQVRATTDLNVNGRKIFYAKHNDVNFQLSKIFADAGYCRPRRRIGCITLGLALAPVGLLLLWLGV